MYTVKRLKAIQAVLQARYTDKRNNRLCVWPKWLAYEHLDLLEKHNLAHHKFYRNLYGHTDHFIETHNKAQ